MNKQDNPLQLKLVALSFLIIGIWYAFHMVYTIIKSHFNIDFQVLGIFICFGLLKHRSIWRTLALVWDWLIFILAPLYILMLILHKPLSNIIKVENYPNTLLEVVLAYFIAIAFLNLAFWQYKVLTTKEIKEKFNMARLKRGRTKVSTLGKVEEGSDQGKYLI